MISRAQALFTAPEAANSARQWWLACLLVLGLGAAAGAGAESRAPWADEPYAYVVVEQEVRATLEAFGRNLAVSMDIAKEVTGKAPRNLRAANAGEFLQRLCASNGLSWFYDGQVLHVGSIDAVAIRQFAPAGVAYESLRAALDEQGVMGEHLGLMPSVHDGEEIVAVGPPAYLALVERTLARLQPPEPTPPAVAQRREQGVRVFRGGAPVERVTRAATRGTD